ncbi:MAG: arylsulfotransferase family protein [Candidatus Altiarchaeota archaeon]
MSVTGLLKDKNRLLGSILILLLILLISSYAAIICVWFFLPTYNEPGEPCGTIDDFDRLRSLGYLDSFPIQSDDLWKKGVLLHDSNLSYPGFNIFHNRSNGHILLLDNDGVVRHRWNVSNDTIDFYPSIFTIIRLLGDGSILVLNHEYSLSKISWDSELIWLREERFHHYVNTDEDGNIYVLSRERFALPWYLLKTPFLNDFINILSPDGTTIKTIPVHRILLDRVEKPRILRLILNQIFSLGNPHVGDGTVSDIFHTNTITILDRDVNGLGKKGDMLLCMRSLNIIVVIDPDTEEVVWSWGQGTLDSPHNPTLLDNGNILIFDNGYNRCYSRIIEVNPVTREIAWEYTADPPTSFFSKIMGSSQKLPNGNVLITESTKGHVFEITHEGEVVWDFWSPDVRRDNTSRRVVFLMERISPDFIRSINKTITPG